MKNQATLNIGTIGHVAHGKSTTIQRVSGKSTLKYKSELERNITIKLGYANAKIYECSCNRPERYSTSEGECSKCGVIKKLIRHVSFVDCPGHEVLMATMLNGTAVMDAALLLVAANEECPQPQTREHLFAVSIMKLKNIIVLQNKIDLISKEQAIDQHAQIKSFLELSNVKAPIIPISSQMNVNIDAVLDYIVNYVKKPQRSLEESPRMIIIRSFDINKPGTKYQNVLGGVIGGSLITGRLKIGDEIEIRPGNITKSTEDGTLECRPYLTSVVSLFTENVKLTSAIPGGLIGVGTNLDPNFFRSDGLVGNIVGIKNSLSNVYHTIEIEYKLFEIKNEQKMEEVNATDSLLFNISSSSTTVKTLRLDNATGKFELYKPCCLSIGERLAISKKHENKWRLIGHGTVTKGWEVKVIYE